MFDVLTSAQVDPNESILQTVSIIATVFINRHLSVKHLEKSKKQPFHKQECDGKEWFKPSVLYLIANTGT